MASSSLATPLPQALRLEITPLRLGGEVSDTIYRSATRQLGKPRLNATAEINAALRGLVYRTSGFDTRT
jgi:hypothetical protein